MRSISPLIILFPQRVASPGLHTSFSSALVSFAYSHPSNKELQLKETIECTGVIWAFMLTPTRKVRRRDGSVVATSADISWREEFIALWKHIQRKKVRNFTWIVLLSLLTPVLRPGSSLFPPSIPSSTAERWVPTCLCTSLSDHAPCHRSSLVSTV